jgi:hypothetical protein
MAGMDFWRDWNNPNLPMYVKYMEGVNVVASLMPLMPSVAKKLNTLLQQFCFPAGTQIAMAEGQKPIEEVQAGDLVWAQNDRTGERSLKRVKQLFVNVAADLMVLQCGTNTVEVTPGHPLWVADQGWKAAGQIQVGDELRTRNGERVAVTASAHKQGHFTVYNFEVEDFRSYFVGRTEVLAHNTCVRLSFKPGWSLSDFSRKARALKSLAQQGKLRKASNASALRGEEAGAFKNRLIRSAYDKFNSTDSQKFARLRDRIRSMDADHVQDLQLGGLDESSNLWLLDSEVNQGLGSQIWQQIKGLPDGTLITDIEIVGP